MPALDIAQTVLQQDGGGALLFLPFLVALAVGLITIAGMWKTFEKAGERGWAAIIPIYNFYVMLKIGDQEEWLLLLMFVPIANLYALYKAFTGVSRAFGQDVLFGLGLWFFGFVFFPLLGFGDYDYQGQPA